MLRFSRRSAIFAFLLATAGVGAFVYGVWPGHWEPKDEPNYSLLEDGFYMGGSVEQPPPGTRAVVNLCEREDPYRCEIHRWEQIPDRAPAPSLKWLRQQVEFVDAQRKAGVPIYVHCYAGVSRAGMVITAYFMFKNKWTRDEALAFVRTKRGIVRPNPAFMKLLEEWEVEVRGKQ